ncbi:MAG: hypothetical protein BWY71_02426 [Planctomycetes bacterium ADurb.Bin412]|nr:MAG: hypothetical protein BWY71_02426 [Planctomycetes bacterium ADurb.Bin412]
MIIHNFQVASGRIILNGVEIFHPNEFNPNLDHMEKTVALDKVNTLYVWIPSNVRQENYFLISINSPFSRRTTYILGSRGADGQPGGIGFDEDLVWLEGQATESFK